jgi:hypothetical protein
MREDTLWRDRYSFLPEGHRGRRGQRHGEMARNPKESGRRGTGVAALGAGHAMRSERR